MSNAARTNIASKNISKNIKNGTVTYIGRTVILTRKAIGGPKTIDINTWLQSNGKATSFFSVSSITSGVTKGQQFNTLFEAQSCFDLIR